MTTAVKTVPIELDKPRNMRLTLGGARAFREATVTPERPRGISILRGDLDRGAEMAEEEWLTLFHIMLRWEDEALTLDQVGEIIDAAGFIRAGEALANLLEDFAPHANGAGGSVPAGPLAPG